MRKIKPVRSTVHPLVHGQEDLYVTREPGDTFRLHVPASDTEQTYSIEGLDLLRLFRWMT